MTNEIPRRMDIISPANKNVIRMKPLCTFCKEIIHGKYYHFEKYVECEKCYLFMECIQQKENKQA